MHSYRYYFGYLKLPFSFIHSFIHSFIRAFINSFITGMKILVYFVLISLRILHLSCVSFVYDHDFEGEVNDKIRWTQEFVLFIIDDEGSKETQSINTFHYHIISYHNSHQFPCIASHYNMKPTWNTKKKKERERTINLQFHETND
jgi:hypothetical protein